MQGVRYRRKHGNFEAGYCLSIIFGSSVIFFELELYFIVAKKGFPEK